jgi:hypothetical protein
MLTRRAFTGVVSCAICAIASEFIASDAEAQATPPATTPGVTRKILSQIDGPAAEYVTLLVEATLEPGVTVGRHTQDVRCNSRSNTVPDLFVSRRRTDLADSTPHLGSHRALGRLATLSLPSLRTSFLRSATEAEGCVRGPSFTSTSGSD